MFSQTNNEINCFGMNITNTNESQHGNNKVRKQYAVSIFDLNDYEREYLRFRLIITQRQR